MRKTIDIAIREFTYNLKRPAFLFAVFGTPAIILVAIIAVNLAMGGGVDLSEYGTVGYIDSTAEQVLSRDIKPDDYPDIFVRYETTDDAEAAARAGDIPAFIELPENYMASGRVVLSTMASPPEELFDAINAFLRANLAADIQHTLALDILRTGGEFDVLVQETNRVFGEDGAVFVTVLPILFGFLLILSSVTTSSFLMNGLVEEKTNRIVEILLTSVSPGQLLVGKLIGMGALGLMQVLTFLLAGVIGLTVASNNNLLSGLTIPPDLAVLAVVFYLLAYILLGAASIAVGAVVGSEQEARQLSAIFVLPVMIPYMLLVSFILDPNGPLPTALSLIPITAPMAILMRTGMTAVPLWQILVSIAGLVIVNIIVLWVSARLFRWGILSTNKMPSLRRIYQILSGTAGDAAPAPKQTEAA